MIDSTLVAPETFRQMILLGSERKMEWDEDTRKNTTTPKLAQNGLQVWKLNVAVTTWRDRGDMIGVSVACAEDPLQTIGVGTIVEFDRLMMGITRTQKGFSTWFSADAARAAGVRSNSDNHLAAKG
jgi:hypothetical protein